MSYLSQPNPQTKAAISAFNEVLTSDNDYRQQALWYKALAFLHQGEQSQAALVLSKLLEEGDYKNREAASILRQIEH